MAVLFNNDYCNTNLMFNHTHTKVSMHFTLIRSFIVAALDRYKPVYLIKVNVHVMGRIEILYMITSSKWKAAIVEI